MCVSVWVVVVCGTGPLIAHMTSARARMDDHGSGDGGGGDDRRCPELPPEMWREVLRHGLMEDSRGVALARTSRALYDLGRTMWREVRRLRMLPIAARLVEDLRCLQAFDALLFDGDGLPSRCSAGGTLCDTRGPCVHLLDSWDAVGGPGMLATLCWNEYDRYVAAVPEGDAFRCYHHIPAGVGAVDVLMSVSFARAVRDVRLCIGGREVVLHPGRVEAGHPVRLCARPRIDLPVLWFNCAGIAATVDTDGPLRMTVRYRVLPDAMRRDLHRGVRQSTVTLACGRRLRCVHGQVDVL